MKNAFEQIIMRRKIMPRSFRATYDKAISGTSLRAAVNAQCLECVCWKTKDIRDCTSRACPLYAVRPYQRMQQKTRQGRVTPIESPNLT